MKYNKLSRVFILALFVLFFTTVFSINTAEARGSKKKPKECRYTHSCQYTVVKDNITYNVSGSATYTRVCGKNSWPSWGCALIQSETIDRIGPAALSMEWGLGCGNVHRYSATIVGGINGKCGSATTTPRTSFPATNLCRVGSAIDLRINDDSYEWACAGIFGGGTVECDAVRISDASLSCTVDPGTGVLGEPVQFTAVISGTTTPTEDFSFVWNVEGVDNPGNPTYEHTYYNATNSAVVEVSATKGNTTVKASCPFERVDCNAGQFYCGDQMPMTSYMCVSNMNECPKSYCGQAAGTEIYRESLDYQLPAGGSISTTTPAGEYITGNQLCAVGSVLGLLDDGEPTWDFSPAYSSWRWQCKNPDAIDPALCKARCMTGEYFCTSKDKCIPESENCDCRLSDSGTVVDQREYCINSNGTCYTCSKVIDYFKLKPGEIPKNQATTLCGGYWQTNEMTEAQRPEGSVDSRVICEMKSAGSSVSVPSNKIINIDPPYNLPIGSHTLTCTQQYKLDTAGEWIDLQSSSVPNKCGALPAIIEH